MKTIIMAVIIIVLAVVSIPLGMAALAKSDDAKISNK